MIAVEWKPWVWEMLPMTFSEETDRSCIRIRWNWMLWSTAEMLGPGFVWGIGLQTLGYPPTWTHTKEEADRVIAACLTKLKEKHHGS